MTKKVLALLIVALVTFNSGCAETSADDDSAYPEKPEYDETAYVPATVYDYPEDSEMPDIIAMYLENALYVTRSGDGSRRPTMYLIEPSEREKIEPRFEINGEIVVNGEIIDAPAARWMHLIDGIRSLGFHNGYEYRVMMGYPLIMIPLQAVAEALGYEVSWNEENQEIRLDDEFKLWIGELQAYYVPGSRQIHLAVAPIIVEDIIFVPASFFPLQLFDGQVVISTGYWKSRADETIVISVAIATEEILSKYDSYIEFIEPDRHFQQKVVIVPNIPLRNFRWIAVGYSAGFYIYEQKEIYVAGEVTPERPFVVTWHGGPTLPHRGISFIDSYDVTRYFTFGDNNACFEESPRGWLFFSEFSPGVSLR